MNKSRKKPAATMAITATPATEQQVKKPRKSKARREAELRLKFFEEYAADKSKNISREFARDQMRRELAVLIATARARILEVHATLYQLCAAFRDPSSFMFELLDERDLGRFAIATRTIDEADSELAAVIVGQKAMPDFMAIAKGFADSCES